MTVRRLLAIGTGAVVLVIAALVLWDKRSSSSKRDPDPGGSVRDNAVAIASRPVVETWRTPDAVGQLRLEGQVIDADEQPVAGARVVLRSEPPREATTEADGTFVFEQLVGREYAVAAWSPRGVAGPIPVRVNATTEPVILRLVAGAGVFVQVVDAEQHKPIAGAEVVLGELVQISMRTDASGKAQLAPVAPGTHRLQVDAPGFARAVVDHAVGGPPGPYMITIELVTGAAVSGRVLDANGAAIAGANISWLDIADPFSRGAGRNAAISDETGVWRIDALPAGSYRFIARHHGYGPAQSSDVVLDGRMRRDGIDLVMPAAATLSGIVLDANNAPVPAATVQTSIIETTGAQVFETRAGDDGRFRISGLPAARLAVVAYDEISTSEVASVEANAGRDAELTLRLSRAGTIEGVVVTSAGESVPEATVIALRKLDRAGVTATAFGVRASASDVSDGAGRFRLTGLAAGAYRLRASTSATPVASELLAQPGVIARPGDRGVRIVLAGTGSITGTVAYAGSAAPVACSVAVDNGLATAATQGRFTIDDVAPGSRYLVVTGPGLVRKQFGPFSVAAGRRTDVGTLIVSAGRRVTGLVRTPSGAPVAGATVRIGAVVLATGDAFDASRDDLLGARRGTTDADGRFALSGLGVGTLYAIAESSAGRARPITIAAGPDDVTIELVVDATSSLEGSVRGGPAVAGIMVSAIPIDAPATVFSVTSGDRGEFRIDRLPPGPYLAQAIWQRGTGAVLQTDRIAITPAKITRHDLVFPDGPGSLRVKVTDGRGAVRFGQVTVSTAGEAGANAPGSTYTELIIEGVTDSEPTFSRLAPGAVTVCAFRLPANPLDPGAQAQIEAATAGLVPACRTTRIAGGQSTITIEVASAPERP